MPSPTYPLETERLLLRPALDGDVDALHAIQRRADITRYLYWSPRSRDEVRALVAKRRGLTRFEKEGDVLFLYAVLRDTGVLIGEFSLVWTSLQNRCGEIGFILHPDHHGRGYATEAGTALLRIGFESAGLHRIIGRCDGRNVASIRAMEKLGMRKEGHFRENECVKGEWTDEVTCAMLAREWLAKSRTVDPGGSSEMCSVPTEPRQ